MFLLTHTGLNLRTIVAMYDRRRPVRDQIATARGFIYYSEHFQPMPVLKFENCYFFRICTDDNWHSSVRFIHVLINCVENILATHTFLSLQVVLNILRYKERCTMFKIYLTHRLKILNLCNIWPLKTFSKYSER